jgi:hypothetical protein
MRNLNGSNVGEQALLVAEGRAARIWRLRSAAGHVADAHAGEAEGSAVGVPNWWLCGWLRFGGMSAWIPCRFGWAGSCFSRR